MLLKARQILKYLDFGPAKPLKVLVDIQVVAGYYLKPFPSHFLQLGISILYNLPESLLVLTQVILIPDLAIKCPCICLILLVEYLLADALYLTGYIPFAALLHILAGKVEQPFLRLPVLRPVHFHS